MPDLTVKHFHVAQVGAPVLHGQTSLNALLRACLVTGFGLRSVDTLVVADGVATATVSLGHSLQPYMVALISGATPSGLNGEKRVIFATNTTFTFDATGISNQTATGTITVKVAPLGWEEPFSTATVSVFRPTSLESTRFFLRVDESADGREARVRAYETMTDDTNGTGPFPAPVTWANGLYWPKASTTSTDPRNWTLFGDHRGFYLHMETRRVADGLWGQSGSIWHFGDMRPVKPSDPYACVLGGCDPTQYGQNNTIAGTMEYAYVGTSSQGRMFAPRAYTSLGASVGFSYRPEMVSAGNYTSGSGADSPAMVYPNGPDGGLILSRQLFQEVHGSNAHLRGWTRGLYRTPQFCHGSFQHRDLVPGTADLVGRMLLAIKCGSPYGNGSQGVMFADITGPWS